MEYQYQNWYHFAWLSGDQTGQQLVHSVDKASWALSDVPPLKAWGMGGRQVCVDPNTAISSTTTPSCTSMQTEYVSSATAATFPAATMKSPTSFSAPKAGHPAQ